MSGNGSDPSDSDSVGREINRREYVAAVSAAATGLLAGCQGGPGGENGDTPSGESPAQEQTTQEGGTPTETQELGERVPTIDMFYWAGLGDTSAILADMVPVIEENLQAIDINANIKPKDAFTWFNERSTDKRTAHMGVGGSGTNSPALLNPLGMFGGYHIRGAGSNPISSNQYANCEATMLLESLKTTSSNEEVREVTHELMGVISQDIANIPLTNRPAWGAYRTDQIEMPDPGKGGVQQTNPDVILDAKTKGDTELVHMNGSLFLLQQTNPTRLRVSSSKLVWDQFFYSPLMRYDKNWQRKGVFATDWEVSDDFQTITFELREGHTAHNGEPITAEDVKWTFEYLDENSTVLPNPESWPYESIDVVDETTVTFNFEQPSAIWMRKPPLLHGILPKDRWIELGAPENPGEFAPPTDDIVGTGPYEITQFNQGRWLQAQPNEDHWNTPDAPFRLEKFQGTQSMARAFREGSLNVFQGMPAGTAHDLQDFEHAKVTTLKGFALYDITPITNFGPAKFREFRMAVSQALNRQRMAQLATFGDAHPVLYANAVSEEYTLYPENHEGLTKVAETPQANPERAKRVLREAGWGWDDDDRLHYPADADLSPLWPKGESPRHYPERWPCVEELGLTPMGSS